MKRQYCPKCRMRPRSLDDHVCKVQVVPISAPLPPSVGVSSNNAPVANKKDANAQTAEQSPPTDTEAQAAALLKEPCELPRLLDELDIQPSKLRALLTKLGAVEDGGLWQMPPPPEPEPEPVAAPLTTAEQVAYDRRIKRLAEENRTLEEKYRHLQQELDSRESALNAALDIKDFERGDRIVFEASTSVDGEAIPIILFSDWHLGEAIQGKTINYQNEYSPTIAEQRAYNVFRNSLKLIDKERTSIPIKRACYWLGGDIINNYLRPEDLESNAMSPTEEVLFAQRILTAGFDMLLRESDLEQIIIPCSYGNHGRTTDKSRITTGATNSYEWLMYHNLRRHYALETRLVWQISDGYITYLNLLGFECGFSHGDLIKYNGGVGGLGIPLRRWALNADQGIKAYARFYGHFHERLNYYGNHVNGSLCGANAYSLGLGFRPSRPEQSFCLIDRDRGMTITAPILCEVVK